MNIGAAEMPTGHYETQTPELSIEEAFANSRQELYDLTFQEGFDTLREQRGISEDATDTPAYWEVAADHANQAADKARMAGQSEKEIVLTELIASTPDFVYKQTALKQGKGQLPQEEYDHYRRTTSYYNGLIREVAEQWPDLKVSQLQRHLLNAANIAVENRNVKHEAASAIEAAVTGAQHELGFAQIASRTGRKVESSTVEQDLKGIDLLTTAVDQPTLKLDIKASLYSVTKMSRDANKPFAIAKDGQITIFSLISKDEFRDKFFIDDKLVEQKAPVADRLLNEAYDEYRQNRTRDLGRVAHMQHNHNQHHGRHNHRNEHQK